MSRTILVASGFVLVIALYATLSGLSVSSGTEWYESLAQPPWQPPAWVFGVIWPLNFLALLVAGVLMARADPARAVPALIVFAVSVGFALAWSFLFYGPHALTASAVALGLAAVLTWVLFALAIRLIGLPGLVLLPYSIWVSLATSLAVWYAVNLRS